MAKIRRVEAVAEKDVQDLSGEPPACTLLRKGIHELSGAAVEASFESLEVTRPESSEVHPTEKSSSGIYHTFVPFATRGRGANSTPGGVLLYHPNLRNSRLFTLLALSIGVVILVLSIQNYLFPLLVGNRRR